MLKITFSWTVHAATSKALKQPTIFPSLIQLVIAEHPVGSITYKRLLEDLFLITVVGLLSCDRSER